MTSSQSAHQLMNHHATDDELLDLLDTFDLPWSSLSTEADSSYELDTETN